MKYENTKSRQLMLTVSLVHKALHKDKDKDNRKMQNAKLFIKYITFIYTTMMDINFKY